MILMVVVVSVVVVAFVAWMLVWVISCRIYTEYTADFFVNIIVQKADGWRYVLFFHTNTSKYTRNGCKIHITIILLIYQQLYVIFI